MSSLPTLLPFPQQKNWKNIVLCFINLWPSYETSRKIGISIFHFECIRRRRRRRRTQLKQSHVIPPATEQEKYKCKRQEKYLKQ